MSTSDNPAATTATEKVTYPIVFRLNRLAYGAVFMSFIVALLIAGVNLKIWGWTLVLPLILGYCIYRLQTTVTETTLTSRTVFSTHTLQLDELVGLRFPKWSATKAVLSSGAEQTLPAVTFADLPVLSAATHGRVPDPYTKSEKAELES